MSGNAAAPSRQGTLTWKTAVKFCMARKFDLNRAKDLFHAHEVMSLNSKGFITFVAPFVQVNHPDLLAVHQK